MCVPILYLHIHLSLPTLSHIVLNPGHSQGCSNASYLFYLVISHIFCVSAHSPKFDYDSIEF